MAERRGGKRRPRKPAPVSGPGRMSRRTDGGPQQTQAQMTGMGYGENQDFMDIQSSAPMAATDNMPAQTPTPSPRSRRGQENQTPLEIAQLFSPTQRPDEPVTAGAPVGMGPGQTAQPSMGDEGMADVQALQRFLPSLMRSANQPDAPAGFVRFVRYLRDMGA